MFRKEIWIFPVRNTILKIEVHQKEKEKKPSQIPRHLSGKIGEFYTPVEKYNGMLQ